ncbi:MAG TPA: phosphodiesterase [Gammaproteobacteria bacterium]|nr:phosphodiesterase [Gammaproteobacteria bacterium]
MAEIPHDLTISKPDYGGGSIVNLMRSIGDACGAPATQYLPLSGMADHFSGVQRIVLLVIDGLGHEFLHSLGFDTVLARHQWSKITSVYPPTTATAITTFLTGRAPQQHGLTGWFMQFRAIDEVVAILPFIPRFGSESLEGSGTAIGSLIGGPNFFDTLRWPSSTLLPDDIYDSAFSRLFCGNTQPEPYSSLSNFVEKLKSFCGGEDGKHYLYAYWSELDRLSHMHGPSSQIVAAHLAEIDNALEPLFDMCAENDTLLIVTADHGFIDTSLEEQIDLADHPDLNKMLRLPLCGEPRSAYCYVHPQCRNTFEHYVDSEFRDVVNLVPSDRLVDEGWFGLGSPHPELSARIGDYTLQMKGRHTVTDVLSVERKLKMNGVHGGTAAAELYVPLILSKL